jgi:hypothetical protein
MTTYTIEMIDTRGFCQTIAVQADETDAGDIVEKTTEIGALLRTDVRSMNITLLTENFLAWADQI